MAETYTCSACHETFGKTWSDEEAHEEAAMLFGDIPATEVVCDDCWRLMMGLPPAQEERNG